MVKDVAVPMQQEACSDVTEDVCTTTEEEVCTSTTVEDTECRTMTVEECRWMKVKVCDPPPSSYLPPAPRSPNKQMFVDRARSRIYLLVTLSQHCSWCRRHDQGRRGKPDPIGDLIRGVGEGVAKIVGDLERSLQKLVDPKVVDCPMPTQRYTYWRTLFNCRPSPSIGVTRSHPISGDNDFKNDFMVFLRTLEILYRLMK